MSLPHEKAKKRFFVHSILLAGIGSLPIFYAVLSVNLAPRAGWILLGLWAVVIFTLAYFQMSALVGWLNPPERNEKD